MIIVHLSFFLIERKADGDNRKQEGFRDQKEATMA